MAVESINTGARHSSAETAVTALYQSLSPAQKEVVCFPWDYQEKRRGLLRSFVSNHWYVTRPFIRSGFYTRQQQALIHDVFTGLINPEWYRRFLKQLRDDTYGQDWGEEQSIAIFGTPEAGPFQFVMTGRHLTLRADGGSEAHMAFGGPILYGHAADGFYTEKPHHPGNVFWYQAERANQVYRMLDPQQQARARVSRLPVEEDVAYRGPRRQRRGIAVADLASEQINALHEVVQALLDPFRPEDQKRVLESLGRQGGLERCSLAFYEEGQLARDGTCDNWRLEGPAFVWYFRGSPHAHVWVNVADTPEVPFNSRIREVENMWPEPIRTAPPTTKVVAVTTVKNEIDIIEAFVRHTLAVVSHLVILENGSTDDTLAILRALEKEGLPLTIIEDASTGKYLSQRMTHLMRDHAVARHGADWVVPLDADEFLVVPEGAPLIPEGASTDQVLSLPWRTYVPDPSDDPALFNPVLRLRHRLVREGYPWVKAMVPRPLAALPGAVLTQGNHALTIEGRAAPTTDLEGPYLAHFPIRGPGQYLAKIAISALQYHTMGAHAAQGAFHWKAPYELLKRDVETFAESIRNDALRFSVPPEVAFHPETMLDPLPYRGGPLFHTNKVEDRARGWSAVLNFAEDLARRYAVMSAGLSPTERIDLEQQINRLMNNDAEMTPRERLLLQERLELQRALNDQRQQTKKSEECVRAGLREVETLRHSWTWRIGTLLMWPAVRGVRGFRSIRRRLRGNE